MERMTNTEKKDYGTAAELAFESAGNVPYHTDRIKVAVIGGGAAGMMAAAAAARAGAAVTVYERNGSGMLGRKLGITGKGRCNVTNDATRDEFLENVPRNPRFLYAAYAAFPPQDVMAYFESLGVPLKTERGRRVFPVSDKASDIVDALKREVRASGCHVVGARVRGIKKEKENNGSGERFDVDAGDRSGVFDRVIICTGGLSYPRTGSEGDGYRMAESFGHTVTELVPSLVPIVCPGGLCPSMQGLSLRNVGLKIVEKNSGKVAYEDFGEIMFTHFGLTGPMALSASARLHDIVPGKYEAQIDLKPALDMQTLDARLLSDFSKYKNRDFQNSLSGLLPQKMIEPFVGMTGIPADLKVNSVTREMRKRIAECLKCFMVPLSGLRPVEEAIITSGGVSVREIDPKTMESKLVPGLYFAGEIIDTDAYTGGYNLQIAWSTARLAGLAAAKRKSE
ncbi:MAG: NAD(P)/FAD-dependent oxidoreductase [Clostridia bacterium]|nr:NAD(P)/FAD-dependent oxidoreductase [Clostridia bacterium]